MRRLRRADRPTLSFAYSACCTGIIKPRSQKNEASGANKMHVLEKPEVEKKSGVIELLKRIHTVEDAEAHILRGGLGIVRFQRIH